MKLFHTLLPRKLPKKQVRSQGFTLIEVLVVVTIMSVLSAVVMWNYRSALNTESAVSGARELRSTIREAQLWSNSSRPFPVDAPDTDPDRYRRGFGVYVTLTDAQSVVLYGGEDTSETVFHADNIVREDELPIGGYIKGLCATTDVTGSNCGDVLNQKTSLWIFYRRPSLSPYINYDDVAGEGFAYARIVIGVLGNSSYNRWIEIYQSGRVEILQQP
jgi:prepilin-type N-terminal cleavage/methylation domain-containing protein